jgi:hypothetical protein
MFRFRFKSVLAAVVCVAAASSLQAILPPPSQGIATKTLRTPGLSPKNDLRVADASPLAALGVQQGRAFRDARTGGWGTIILSEPLLSGAADREQAAAALYGFVADHASTLDIDPAELETGPRVTVHDGGALVQIHAQRVISGILVRDAGLSAVVNHGNLVLFGLRNWAEAPSSVQPSVSAAVAKTALAAHLAPYAPSSYLRAPRLELVPFAAGGALSYRLVWVFTPRFNGSNGSWEGLVDAASGQVLAFRDTNNYAVSQRSVIGAVLPVANDNVDPDGIEQLDFPMPFADLTELGTQRKVTTDSGGNAPVCMEGPMFMRFDSKYVKMMDTCGAAPVVPATGDTLDLGQAGYPNIDPHPGTNCALVTSPLSSAVPGNTRASRSGFYEVNRLKEQARGQLPDNTWLQDQLTANMNIAGACNAFWNGQTINFYPDTAACRNTGEIAAVFDHEWGHGMDANGARPGVSSPGESIADMFANVRLAQSCTGRGFVRVPPESPVQLGCGHGYGDKCTACAGGIRDSDFLKHESRQPHDVAWSLPACAPEADDQLGPCGGETHCEGTFVAEAVWDLMSRDLRCQGAGWSTGGAGEVGGGQCVGGAAASRDFPTALELATKLTYHGGGFVGDWFQCKVDGTAGCNTDGGYLNYLAADDDNGNLEDGTPHMTAIHAAFARHGIGCSAIPVHDSGCSGAPTVAPVVTAVPLDRAVKLSWAPVAGATRYEVFRTEGVFGCDFGKIKVGETTDTEFVVDGLRNGFEVYFTVAAAGSGQMCLGPMSACTPAAAAAGGPGLAIDKASFESEIRSGDGDLFLDNCERAQLRFTFRNSGSAPLTNPRVIAVRSPSHPATTSATPLPAVISPSVPVCGEAQAAVEIVAGGLANDDVLQVEIEMTSDELAAAGVSRTVTFELRTTEGDFRFFPSRTFDFESGLGMWRRLYGTFDPASEGGGADGTAAYLASSSFADSACDGSATPLVQLTASSTVDLWNNFDIEPDTVGGAAGWDRANVRLRDFATGTQTLVQPSGGRGYNVLAGSAGEFSGACGDMPLQAGWGGAMPTWASSSFTAADLGSAGVAGAPLQVVVQYGADASASFGGFWLDQVRVTNAEVEVPDTQGDVCRAPCSELDDDAPAIEYTGGWHRKSDAAATSGGYHERAGNNKKGAAVRVVFDGDEITYLYGVSNSGGTADILIDGVLRETLSYQGAGGGVSFGRAVTYANLGAGRHELKIVHRSGKVFVDGFRINCDGAGGADASAPQFRSRTEVFTASAGGGPIIVRQVQVGPKDVALSVMVEGLAAPLTVQLLGPLGSIVAQGGALIPGLSLSGLDAAVTPGTYKVQFPNTVAPGQTVRISVAHTERVP